MYHNYTPQFLWAGVSKHDEDSSLNSTPKTTRSSEPCQIVIKKKEKDRLLYHSFWIFFSSYSIRKFNNKKKDNAYVHLLRSGSLSCPRSV